MSLDIRQGDWLSALRGPVNAITTTATARAWAWNYCTGTSYTVTLPPAASFKDGFIGFRMAPIASLTGLATLDGNAAEEIDEETTRKMWAGEAAVIYSDGSNLFKIAGKSLAMCVTLSRASDQVISSGVWTAVTLTAVVDGPAQMFDSGRAKIVRPSLYEATSLVYLTGIDANTTIYSQPIANATTPPGAAQQIPSEGGGAQGGGTMPALMLAANDYINASVYGTSSTTLTIAGAVNPAFLVVKEIPQW